MGNVWAMHGQCTDNVWAMYGQCMGNARARYGQCMDNVWTMYGQFISNCKGIIHDYMETGGSRGKEGDRQKKRRRLF